MKKHIVTLTAGLATACVFTSLAVFTSLGAQQAPVFKSKVEVVQLDVSVLDKHRQPVKGLTEQDFTILEDGKPQKVVAFSTFDMDDDAPPAVGWMRDVAPDVETNDLKETRLFVLVMDDAMVPQEPAFIRDAKKIAASIIDKLGPDDLTAVVFTGDNRKTQDFTNDKAKLRAALDKFNPGLTGYHFGIDTCGVDVDAWFYLSSVRTLSNLADFLIAAPNRRKAVFWVSPGVPLDFQVTVPTKMQVPTLANACPPPSQPPKVTETDMRDLQDKTQEIFRRAQRSNVTIYPIDPTGLGGLTPYLNTRTDPTIVHNKVIAMNDFIVSTATNTGGRVVMNTNDYEPGITEIFKENSSYYLIGYEPSNSAADGTFRKLQVKVNRPDVDVRTRSNYYAPQPEKPVKPKDVVPPETAELSKAISGLLPLGGLPMRVATAPVAIPGQRLATVTIVLGIRQPIPDAASKDRITETTELLTTAFTPEGEQKNTQRQTAKVVLRAGSNGEAAYEVLSAIALPAGRYRLRLAAHNATSTKSGSVYADVTVPDFSNVPFSATLISLAANPGRVAAPKDLLSELLPIVPTAEREFAGTDKVTAFLRLYQSSQKPIERVQVAFTIRDGRDQLSAMDARTIGAVQFITAAQQVAPSSVGTPMNPSRGLPSVMGPAPSDRFANLALRSADVIFPIPMNKLSAGPHLLTIEATLGATTIRRDVRFEVSDRREGVKK